MKNKKKNNNKKKKEEKRKTDNWNLKTTKYLNIYYFI